MDIFNKKKILKMEDKINCLEQDNIKLNNDANTYRDIIHNYSLAEKRVKYLEEENEKLLNWIEKILDASNIYRLKEGDRYKPVTIPMYKEEMERFDLQKTFEPLTERIIIPELQIIRKRFGG